MKLRQVLTRGPGGDVTNDMSTNLGLQTEREVAGAPNVTNKIEERLDVEPQEGIKFK